MKKFFLMSAALCAMLWVPVANAATALSPADVSVTSLVTVDVDCTNSPGPIVTISGSILIGEFPVTIGFYQNKNKQLTIVDEETVEIGLGTPIAWSKKHFTGNPILTGQLAIDGVPYGGPIDLGRCVSPHRTTTVSVPTDLLTDLLVSVIGCQNHPGPQITLTGTEQVLEGVTLTVTGTNNTRGTHTQTATTDVVVVGVTFPLDGIIVEPKQDVGGNPVISVNGTRLGRCNQIN